MFSINYVEDITMYIVFFGNHLIPKYTYVFLFLVITDSNKTQDLRGQTVVNFNLELLSPQQRKVNLNLSPEEFYNLCLEMEKAKLQLEMILQKVK